MSDVNLGSVKAKLELDASGVQEGADKAASALQQFSGAAEAGGNSLVAFGAAAGAGAAGVEIVVKAIEETINVFVEVVHGIADATTKFLEFSESIEHAMARVGESAEKLEQLKAAANVTGVSFEGITTAITRMNAVIGSGKQSKLLESLGLDRASLDAASPIERMKEIVDATEQIQGASERAYAQRTLLSRGYVQVIEAERLGTFDLMDQQFKLSDASIEIGAGIGRAWKQVAQDWEFAKLKLGELIVTSGLLDAAFSGAINVTAAVVSEYWDLVKVLLEVVAVAEKTGAALTFLYQASISPASMGAAWDTYKAKVSSIEDSTAKAIQVATKAQEDQTKAVIEYGVRIQNVMAMHVKAAGAGEGGLDLGLEKATEDAKKLQAEIDKLSGAKAQAEMDRIAQAVHKLGIDGVADVDALGKRLVKLASEGATIPQALMGAWSDATLKDLGNLKLPSEDSLNKSAEDAWKGYVKTVKASSKEAEEAVKQHFENLKLLEQNQGDILEQQYNLGLISTKDYYTQVGNMQVDHYRKLAEQARAAAAIEKDPALRAALLAQAAAYERIAVAAGRAAAEITRAAQVSKVFSGLDQILAGVADVFDAIGISADSAIGKIVSGLQTASAAVQDFASQTTTAGKIGSGLSAAAGIYKTGQEKGKAAGALSGAVTGAGIGFMVGGPLGAGVGAAAGAVVGFLGGLRKPEYKKIMADVGKSWGVSISEGLGKEIEQIAKANKISRSLAELMNVSKIIGESGKDPREFTGKINDLMNAIKSGAVPAKEGLAELGKAFTMVADAAIAAGTVGDKAMVGLITRARELGEVTPEMKAFVGTQLDSALAGIHKYVAAIEKLKDSATTTPEKFAEIGKTSGIVFGAMFDAMVSEHGIVAAVDAMKDDYNSLNETLSKTLGPEAVSAILGPFGGAFATLQDETLRPIFEGIDGITQAMTGLANAGYLSTDQFGAMQDATAQLFDEAIAGGADMHTALLAVAPGIQAAISAAEQFGVPLDADMQRLKSLAEQNGITFKTDPQAAMLDVLVSIAEVLGAQVPESARRAAAAMRDLADSVPTDLNVNVNVNRTYTGGEGGGGGEPGGGGNGGGGGGEPYEGYQHGTGGIRDFGPGTNVTLHGREAVMTEKQLNQMGGGPTITLSPTFVVDPMQTNESRAQLSQYQIEEFVRQVRSNPLFQQILRDQGLR